MANIKGIDISEFQGVLDWSKVKAAGIKFAIIRAGYGRYETDSCFHENARRANAAGIPIGVYWFSYAVDVAGAKQEAQKCLEVIKEHKVTLPVYFDFEYDTVAYAKKQGVTLGKQAFNDHAVAFCDTIQAAGYRAGVYYNLDYLDRLVDMNRIKKYSLWFAQYNSYAQASGWDLWQYTSSGSISGISARFDMNQADESYLTGSGEGGQTYKPGWQKDGKGWWYRWEDGGYPKSQWEKIDGKWYYFGEDGYMASGRWISGFLSPYYVGEDGAMVTNRTLRIDSDGKLVPAGSWYHLLKEVPKTYRAELDKLIAAGKLKGSGGSGEDLILDMSEEAVRVLVIQNR